MWRSGLNLFDAQELLVFTAAALALNFTPGPDMLYVAAHSLGGGRRVAFGAVLGITTGRLIHLGAAVAGVSAIVASSPAAFFGLRWAGAIYLVWIGVQMLRTSDDQLAWARGRDEPIARVYRRGVVTNVLNPKVALFYLAFLPQFVNPDRGFVALQIVILGLIQNLGGTAVQSAIAALGGGLGEWLARHPTLPRWQARGAGSMLIGLGIYLLVPPFRR